jgi:hypothetical protein
MNDPKRTPWNSLEAAKLLVGLLTPLLLFWLGHQVNQSFRVADQARADALQAAQQAQRTLDEERRHASDRHEALMAYSRLIYERRVRSELLASSLSRHMKGPTPDSKQELIERKRSYDQTYAAWNAQALSNLLLVRRVVDPARYSAFENLVEFRLARTFSKLDACLTTAYDFAIRSEDPGPTLADCDVPGLLQTLLDCGYTIVEELSRISSALTTAAPATERVESACPAG